MASVSTLLLSMGAAMPLSWVNAGMPAALEGALVETEFGVLDLGRWRNRMSCFLRCGLPASAAAAAIAGDMRWVRPPAPWRPSKLRFEAHRATSFSPLPTSVPVLRSSIRAFVQEPRKTLSRTTSVILVPASRPMYSRARVQAFFAFSSLKSSGPGTTPVIPTTS
ncbi:hypothetical protein KC354_g40 [Hortaea werneckii]|nr:hypothetical protein KC354_g40 [Hortaea werneckii]